MERLSFNHYPAALKDGDFVRRGKDWDDERFGNDGIPHDTVGGVEVVGVVLGALSNRVPNVIAVKWSSTPGEWSPGQRSVCEYPYNLAGKCAVFLIDNSNPSARPPTNFTSHFPQKLKEGDFVRRGPNWDTDWNSQDTVAGFPVIGKVIAAENEGRQPSCTVLWSKTPTRFVAGSKAAVYPHWPAMRFYSVFVLDPSNPSYCPPGCPSFTVPSAAEFSEVQEKMRADRDNSEMKAGAQVRISARCLDETLLKKGDSGTIVSVEDGLINVRSSTGSTWWYTMDELINQNPSEHKDAPDAALRCANPDCRQPMRRFTGLTPAFEAARDRMISDARKQGRMDDLDPEKYALSCSTCQAGRIEGDEYYHHCESESCGYLRCKRCCEKETAKAVFAERQLLARKAKKNEGEAAVAPK